MPSGPFYQCRRHVADNSHAGFPLSTVGGSRLGDSSRLEAVDRESKSNSSLRRMAITATRPAKVRSPTFGGDFVATGRLPSAAALFEFFLSGALGTRGIGDRTGRRCSLCPSFLSGDPWAPWAPCAAASSSQGLCSKRLMGCPPPAPPGLAMTAAGGRVNQPMRRDKCPVANLQGFGTLVDLRRRPRPQAEPGATCRDASEPRRPRGSGRAIRKGLLGGRAGLGRFP